MEDFIATQTHSMMECFVATQTLQNEEFRKQSLYTNETLRKLNTVVDSLVTHNEALETQISLLAHTPLEPFPEKHADIVTVTSEKSTKNPKESDNEEDSGEKRVDIEKDLSTPTKREVVEEVEKEELCVVPPPYESLIPFPRRSVEVKVDPKSERYEELLENIHTNAPLFETLNKKRKLEDRETRELIRGKLDSEVVDEKIEPKPEKLALRIEPEPPPQACPVNAATFMIANLDRMAQANH
ncbi:uncharacterized protein LOC127099527 [Lathyrus oleraceus]|uniref:uncharacterized protein LOC127099527 n=1 Tax=Pisum sativum TaxID=3888 RepID=UPI0021D338EE|nr:uncharacterized protein LOC127099527 [Pisum sativum]